MAGAHRINAGCTFLVRSILKGICSRLIARIGLIAIGSAVDPRGRAEGGVASLTSARHFAEPRRPAERQSKAASPGPLDGDEGAMLGKSPLQQDQAGILIVGDIGQLERCVEPLLPVREPAAARIRLLAQRFSEHGADHTLHQIDVDHEDALIGGQVSNQ
jgi:hypothetical protein